jgi:flagellar hook protein FlgE
MSIYGAMFSGVSGLAAQSQALGMISDNISNLNTVGYKGSTPRFQTLVTQTGVATKYSPGGVRGMPYQRIDTQGLLQNSASSTDLAIMGSGFFVVADTADAGIDKSFLFTRAGSFTVDSAGRLVTKSGFFLQGWRLDEDGNLPASATLLSDLETVAIPQITAAAVPSSGISLGLNLPSQAAISDEFQTTVQLFDKQGATQNLEVTWTKTAANSWSLSAALGGTGNFASDNTGTATLDDGQPTPVQIGTVTFAADGSLATVSAVTPASLPTPGFGGLDANGNLTFYVDYDGSAATTSAADRQLVTIDLGTPGAGDGVTQYASEFFTSQIDQNGRGIGAFAGIAINDQGTVTALFDNGQQRDIYKLPVAVFRNPNGLEAQNGNTYKATERSGDAVLAQANSAGAGVVTPNSLEASNVDLAEEFTNMIITQRAYSANAKVITTADQMLAELMQMSR